MRDASPQSPQQEQRYLRDVFRERGDLLGDGWAAAPLPAPRAVPPPADGSPDSPARVPPPLEGAERDTRQPEDTTAPRKSAAALRATLADGWAAPALSSKRRDAPHRAAPSTPEPSALDTIAASVASLFTSPPSDSPGQSYDQYMQTHESPKRAPLMDYETTASTEERGPELGRGGYDPGQRVVPALDACGCAFEMFSPSKPRSPRLP